LTYWINISFEKKISLKFHLTLSVRCFWYPNASEISDKSWSNVWVVRRLSNIVIVLCGFSFPCLTIVIVRGLLCNGSTPYRFCFELIFFCCCWIELAVAEVSDCKKILFAWKRFVDVVGPLLAPIFGSGIVGKWRAFTRCGGCESCKGGRTKYKNKNI
jgi:hypothetical protein